MDSDIEELSQKHGGYWGEHDLYPLSDWQEHVRSNETRRGYWEWVEAQMEMAKDEQEAEKAASGN